MKKKVIFLLIVGFMTGIVACEYEMIKPEPPIVIDDSVEYSFSTDIYPMFDSCKGCHGSSGGVDLGTVEKAYTTLSAKNLITPGANTDCGLVTKLKAGHNNSFTPNDFAKIEHWVDKGAKNN